jgi:hypothetical protein
MVGRYSVHLAGLLGYAAEKIPTAYDNRNLNPQRIDVSKFRSDFVDAKRIDAEALRRRQGLTGEFKKDAFEDGSGHA